MCVSFYGRHDPSIHCLYFFTHVKPVKYTPLFNARKVTRNGNGEIHLKEIHLKGLKSITLLDKLDDSHQLQREIRRATVLLLLVGKQNSCSFERINTSLTCTTFPVVTITVSKTHSLL